MSDKAIDKVMIAEHIFEVRHEASGAFLDVRGDVADYIRQEEHFFPHWSIDDNVVNFRDDPQKIVKEGGFVGFKSAGYVAFNPETRNYFMDRASAFWKILLKNPHFPLPTPTRFGTRTKIFIPCPKAFNDINKQMYEALFTEEARLLFDGNEQDLMFTVEIKEAGFDIRVIGGPIHKDEASKHFQFKSDYFEKCGLFLDIDYYRTSNLTQKDVPQLLRTSIELMWKKAEGIARGLGF
jgi:hypothetical protein